MDALTAAAVGAGSIICAWISVYNLVLYFTEDKPQQTQDVCPFCGAKTAAIDYHLEKRCRKRPKSIRVKARSFKKGERPW